MKKLNILIIDDEKGIRDELVEHFTENKYLVYSSASPTKALEMIQKNEIDIVILDIKLPEMDGLVVLEKIKTQFPDIEVIMITGHGDTQNIIQSMRLGAFDFFMKPFRILDIERAIERTEKFILLNIQLKKAELAYNLVSQELQNTIGKRFIGQSPEIKKVMSLMSTIAEFDFTAVLISGESGTGKELVARGIHYLSKRKNNYFFPVNCSAVPTNLFESEFFGHRKGAFTGATENRMGYFEIANQGTLFLDEIGDLPLPLQSKFLRVIEEKRVKKIGSDNDIATDVRIISATNRKIGKMVEKKEFRLDLYHRINTFRIDIPPLRDRREDIAPLLDYFLEFYAEKLKRPVNKIDAAIYEELYHYPFLGNVRELQNMVERAVILCNGSDLKLQHFKINDYVNPKIHSPLETKDIYDLKLQEKMLIKSALEKTKNNKAQAAKLLNINWNALDRRMKKYNI
jgi:DNA-binding NtrC family response regulator